MSNSKDGMSEKNGGKNFHFVFVYVLLLGLNCLFESLNFILIKLQSSVQSFETNSVNAEICTLNFNNSVCIYRKM